MSIIYSKKCAQRGAQSSTHIVRAKGRAGTGRQGLSLWCLWSSHGKLHCFPHASFCTHDAKHHEELIGQPFSHLRHESSHSTWLVHTLQRFGTSKIGQGIKALKWYFILFLIYHLFQTSQEWVSTFSVKKKNKYILFFG